MLANVENARLFLPAEDPEKPNVRPVIHPETNGDQVLMDAEGTTLREFLGPQIIISDSKPKGTALWAEITGTRTE